MDKESLNTPLADFFVTICDLVYFYTSLAYSKDLLLFVAVEKIIIRSTIDTIYQLFTDKSWIKAL
jgi:hypothetical protein